MNIKVNDTEWKALQTEEQKNIEEITKEFFKGAVIVPDSTGVSAGSQPQGLLSNPWCKPACSVVEAAAIVACAALSGPAAAVCIIIAKAAGDACRDDC